VAPELVKRLTLTAAILGSAIALLDSTIVSVALPTIQRSLGGGLAGQQWISSAYLLTLGSLILIGGSLGDILASVGCSRSAPPASAWRRCCARSRRRSALLTAALGGAGVAGALLTPSSLAVIAATFPDDERGAAIGTGRRLGQSQR